MAAEGAAGPRAASLLHHSHRKVTVYVDSPPPPRCPIAPQRSAMKRTLTTLTTLVHLVALSGCDETASAPPNPDNEATATCVGSSEDCPSSPAKDADSHATTAVDAAIPSTPTDASEQTRALDSRASLDSGLSPDAATCDVPLAVELSPNISTVVLLTWTEPGGWTDAEIEYWSERETHKTAVVDVGPSEPTPVIGLIADTVYKYRITAKRSGAWCSSVTSEVRTGSAPDSLPQPVVSADAVTAVGEGYLLTTPESDDANASGYVAIYDSAGRPVWWYRTSLPGLLSRAHFSWDGREVWVRDANPLGRSAGRVVRIPIDGSEEEPIEMDLGHHDFVPVPDGFLFLVGGGEDTCDIIQHRSKDGEVTAFYSLRDAFGETFRPGELNACHCNAIDYNLHDESVSVSCLNQNAFVKISSEGELVWVLGGNNGQSHFTGDVNWDRQHGHHLISPTRMVFFNNLGGGDSTDTSALAVELQLDLEAKTANRVWEYASDADSAILGDAQYLPNGNVLVTYSSAGEIHEVNTSQERVRLWKFPDGIGYSQHYADLPTPHD